MKSEERKASLQDRIEKGLIWFFGIGLILAALALFMPASCDAHITFSRSKKVRALETCTMLEQAVQRFYDDNGTLPVEIAEDSTFSSNSEKGLELLRVLLNQEATDPPLNGKGINYLSFKEGSPAADFGLVWNDAGTKVTGLYDPWGGSYMIALDGDFDEAISVQPKAYSSARNLQRRVAVWSNGKDGAKKTGKVYDDITTW